MLYKSKINLTLILLIFGIGIIPTGLFVRAYLYDNVNSQVAPFLYDMKSEVSADIQENYLGLGLYRILPAIYNKHFLEIRAGFALVNGIPPTLLYLQNVTLEHLPEYINASRAASVIANTISDVISDNSTTPEVARNVFFNNYTFQDDFYSTIEGVSENMMGGSESLNYSSYTINYLLYGRTYNSSSYPGLLQDVVYGTKLLDWLDFYYDAETDLGTNRSLIETVYNCTWISGQLQNLSAYISNYLWDVIIKNDYAPMELESYAELVFYDQWANGSWISSGFDLQYFSEYITSSITGLEVGRTTPTNINYTSAINLWDPLNSSSFVNDEGIFKWFAAYDGNLTIQNELKSLFKLKDTSMTRIYTWLFSTVRNSLVNLIYTLPDPIGIGMSISEYSKILFAEQWANGTYIANGFDLEAKAEPYEIGIPTKSNISLISTLALLDTSNRSSFNDRDGILKWIDAYEGDTTAQTELITTFHLNMVELNMINNWLFTRVRYNISLAIALSYTNFRMANYAEFEFYRQWANATSYQSGLDIGPFQGLSSISGWEIGIPISTNIDNYTSYFLWNRIESYSFINSKGISHWFKAMNNAEAYNNLYEYVNTKVVRYRNHYYNASLSYSQLDGILNWLIHIREDFVLNNIQIMGNLPTNSYILGDNIFFIFTITGGVIGGIGLLGIVVLLISKRK
ncbi:MAG: hypothetical protein ACFFDF_09810 [Candidatus Odinarchaeota archaeon]